MHVRQTNRAGKTAGLPAALSSSPSAPAGHLCLTAMRRLSKGPQLANQAKTHAWDTQTAVSGESSHH